MVQPRHGGQATWLASLYDAARNFIVPSSDNHQKKRLAQTQHEVTSCRCSAGMFISQGYSRHSVGCTPEKAVSDLQGALIDRRHTQVHPCNLWLKTQQDGALTQPQSALVFAAVLKQVWRALSSRELSVPLLLEP